MGELAATFGADAHNEYPDGDGTAFTLNQRFPGQCYDAESGLHYNYFRDYEPGTGRYIESDPFQMMDSISTYSYAHAKPLGPYDQFGLATFLDFPPDKERKMQAAVEEAIQILNHCKGCHDCGSKGQYSKYCIDDFQKQEIIRELKVAIFTYQPNRNPVCGRFKGGSSAFIFPSAFSFTACCKLSSTVAHEEGHMAGLDENKSLYLELKRFGCNGFGKSSE